MVSLLTWSVCDLGRYRQQARAEVVKSRGLEKEFSEVKDTLQKESDEHDNPRVAVQLVYDELELASEQEISSLVFMPPRSWTGHMIWQGARFTLAFTDHSRSPVLITRTSI